MDCRTEPAEDGGSRKRSQLIEQQKLVGLNPSSPPASPTQSPLRGWTGWSQVHDLKGGKRTIEVSISEAEVPESTECSIVSLTSGLNIRRSLGATSH